MRLSVVAILAMSLAGCHMHQAGCQPCRSELFCCTKKRPYCRCIDEMKARHAARLAAEWDIAELSKTCGMLCDYKEGFEQAYVDVAMGADGQVPVLPPKEYWKDKNRTSEGHQRAQAWFAGYADGARRAVACGAQHNVVPTSGQDGYPYADHSGQPSMAPPVNVPWTGHAVGRASCQSCQR